MILRSLPRYCVGIDLADRSFVATLYLSRTDTYHTAAAFAQSDEGFAAFILWMKSFGVTVRSSVIGMETTGNLSQKLCYYLHDHHWRIVVEDAARIKRSLSASRPKNDTADSRAIAAYLARFYDRLVLWKPAHPILESIHTLLSFREHLVKTATAHQNFRRSHLKRQHVNTTIIDDLSQRIDDIKEQLKELRKQIRTLIASHEPFERFFRSMDSVPGVDLLLAANILVTTNGDPEKMNYKKLANYLGICPHERSSGTSLRKKARSSRLGDTRIRKLLHLAARSVAVHQKDFKEYYLKKLRQGKPKLLILNNIANRIIKIICALARKNSSFQNNYLSSIPIPNRS